MSAMKALLERLEEEQEDQAALAQERNEVLLQRLKEQEERAARERGWATRHPREWAEWMRIQVLLGMPHIFEKPYEFDEFLQEVGTRPSEHVIKRIDESLPYQRANLRWAEPQVDLAARVDARLAAIEARLGVSVEAPPAPAVKLLTKGQVAEQLGISPRTIDRLRAGGKLHALQVSTGKKKPRVQFDPEQVKAALKRLKEK